MAVQAEAVEAQLRMVVEVLLPLRAASLRAASSRALHSSNIHRREPSQVGPATGETNSGFRARPGLRVDSSAFPRHI